MFMGEYTHSIDSKGRLIIPAKFRELLGTHFIVTRGLDGCLFGYPLNEWEQLQEKLKALPLTKRDARAFVRFLYSAATDCEFDKQGRINLPDTLCQHAKLQKKCVVVGSLIGLKFGVQRSGSSLLNLLKMILTRLLKI